MIARERSVAVARDRAAEIRLSGITRRFGDAVAVDDLTLVVPPGRMLSLLGPSGCGKTTTLRILAGLEHADAGAIVVGGRDMTRVPPYRRNIGMVFQNYSLFPHMSVGRNVAFGLEMERVPASEIAPRVNEALALVRLEGFATRAVNELSGGQQQRVALARALVKRPTILLMDEPLGALDRNLREAMQVELRRLQTRIGITSVLVTHDQDEALTMSDLIAVMSAGRVLQCGSPSEVYDRPNCRFVAQFLGASNILRCEVVEGAPGRAVVRLAGIALPVVHPRALEPGRQIDLAIRPERIALSATPTGEPGEIEARLSNRIFRGAHSLIELMLAGGSTLSVQLPAGHPQNDTASLPEMLFAHWRPKDATVLDD